MAPKNMKLFIQADKIVREFMPAMLYAAGDYGKAMVLRNLFPIENTETATMACDFLLNLEFNHERCEWVTLIKDFSFWVEAAIRAATQEDPQSFKEYVEQATDTLNTNLSKIYALSLN
jgi:hypothetical protein